MSATLEPQVHCRDDLQETVIMEASQAEESTDAVLKEHAIPTPLSEDLNHLVLEEAQIDEDEWADEDTEEEKDDTDINDKEPETDSEEEAREQDL